MCLLNTTLKSRAGSKWSVEDGFHIGSWGRDRSGRERGFLNDEVVDFVGALQNNQ